MSHPHASLIAQLGGAAELSRALGNLGVNVTGNWRARGIPWGWRHDIAKLAAAANIELPEGFLSRRAPAQENAA